MSGRAPRLPDGVKARFIGAPNAPRKEDCPGHVAQRDSIGRLPIGDCGPDCLIRRYRLGEAVYIEGEWV